MYERWTQEEVILAYLLAKAPANRIYTTFRHPNTKLKSRSRPDYELISREFNLARLELESFSEEPRNASSIQHLLHTRRAHTKELSNILRFYKVKREAA